VLILTEAINPDSHQNTLQKDIRQLDFSALYQAGYRGAVFDKDNCLVRCFLVLLVLT
jgi:predicted HAD superfamily phosphohydrolase YqeG